MRGSEKQIKWAEDIKVRVREAAEKMLDKANNDPALPEDGKKNVRMNVEIVLRIMDETEYAGDIIDVFGGIRNWDNFVNVMGMIAVEIRHNKAMAQRATELLAEINARQ